MVDVFQLSHESDKKRCHYHINTGKRSKNFIMHSLPHHTSQPPSMEDQNQCKTSDQQLQNLNLPKVLLHGPPGFSSVLQPPYSEKFHLLNHSSLPLHQFAATHPHHCATVAAVLCDGGYPLTVDMLSLLPSLRLVVTASAGTDHVDLDECRRRGIQVAGAGNLFSEDVADLAVALLIDVVMKISAADRSLRKRHVDSRAITYASKVRDFVLFVESSSPRSLNFCLISQILFNFV